MRFRIEHVWIDEDVADEPLTRTIVKGLPDARVLVGSACADDHRRVDLMSDPMEGGKRVLRLMRHRGAFVKPCPGTPQYVCCGLQILHIGQGCPMDCRYCALQVYFNRPVLEVFVNQDEMLSDLQKHLDGSPGRFHRICTGEFTDSLALDPLTGLAHRLVQFFSAKDNASLEIKTKTDLIEPLLLTEPTGTVVISFSMNSVRISQTEERRAAPLDRRLSAAVKAQARGYLVGFHFDPIIPLAGWNEEYCSVIDRIFRVTDRSRIAWISLGVLRFVPRLKEVTTARFGPIPYFHDGFVPGLDGKSRLHVDRRVRVYQRLAERIRHHSPDARIYLCMESPHVWHASLGVEMASNDDLSAYLDQAVHR